MFDDSVSSKYKSAALKAYSRLKPNAMEPFKREAIRLHTLAKKEVATKQRAGKRTPPHPLADLLRQLSHE